ncbi:MULTISPECIES: hypothetical protein [unclassified Streptomyces]|uniref:hypothetical protein n=1 Tax=unclassified Streptomyces TaxID=2593676 RepID=UPI00344FD7F8
MTDTATLDHYLREHPLCADVISRLPEPPDGAANDLVRTAGAGEDTPLHWATLIRWVDQSLDPQVTGYALGLSRFPQYPAAVPYQTLAGVKLAARPLWQAAEEAMRELGAPLREVPRPNARALGMPWYFLWLGATANAACSGVGLWTGILHWFQFSSAMVRICDRRPDLPPEIRRVFARFETYPTELMKACLDLGEGGLASGESADDALTAAYVGISSMDAFLSECVR